MLARQHTGYTFGCSFDCIKSIGSENRCLAHFMMARQFLNDGHRLARESDVDTYEIRFSSGKEWLAVTCRALSVLAAIKKASGLVPHGTSLEIWKDNRCVYSEENAVTH